MTRRLAAALAALLVAAPAAARAPRHRPATVARHHRATAASRRVDAVLDCYGFRGLATHVARMTAAYVASPSSTEPTDVAARTLVKATHGERDLVAAERRVVARLDPALLRAAAAFCHTRAGRAYGRLMNAGASLRSLKKPPKADPRLAAAVERLVAKTSLVEATEDENLLAVRNAAGARAMIDRSADPASATQGARLAFLKGFRARVADGVKQKLGDHGAEMRAAVLRLTTITLGGTPKAEVEAMVRFFRSRAGKAVEKALVDALHAAMDGAWDRMATQFVAGKLGTGPGKATAGTGGGAQ